MAEIWCDRHTSVFRVYKIEVNNDSGALFCALSGNRSLRELTIETTSKMSVLLLQTLPSTSITTLDLRTNTREGLGDEGSLAFKQFVNKNRVLTVLTANDCGLTNKAFNGITFPHESPLTELSVRDNEAITDEGWTELFSSLNSSCIITLDISHNDIATPYGSECYKALKQLLTNSKTLTVLTVGSWNKGNDSIKSCIADALSENCSLEKLILVDWFKSPVINEQPFTKLFESLRLNTTLMTLNCRQLSLSLGKSNDEVSKSLCEMLKHNQDLQHLIIRNDVIKGHLKEFAMAYTQRQPVLNLTVEKLDIELFEEIEKLQPDADYIYNINRIDPDKL